jgi:hypothetical protein
MDLMARLLKLCTKPGDWIVDPFMGSDSTGLGCLLARRNFVGLEIDERYFKVAKKRMRCFAEEIQKSDPKVKANVVISRRKLVKDAGAGGKEPANDIAKPEIGFPNKKYEIIYADPPWKYYGDQNKIGAAGNHYKTMSVEDIMALPVKDIIAKDAICFMWATSSSIPHIEKIFNAWGFQYNNVAGFGPKPQRMGCFTGQPGQGQLISKPKILNTCLLVQLSPMANVHGPVFPISVPIWIN